MLAELADHFTRFKALTVGGESLDHSGCGHQQPDIMIDRLFDAGPQYLDRHLSAVLQRREMHLCNRGTGNRNRIEFGKHVIITVGVDAPQDLLDLFRRERRHTILQARKFISDIGGYQVAPGR